MLVRILVIVAICAVVALVVVGLVIAAAQDIRRRGRKERPRPSDVAIILGAYTDGYRPSPPLIARLRAGLVLYRNGFISYFIVSGGRGSDETISESRSMKRFLTLNGVPPEFVLEERLSNDTWENLRNSKSVMEQHEFQTAIVVTSDYHLPRALAVASHLGIKASGFAAWSSRREFRTAVREVLARVQYILSGRAVLIRRDRYD